jgi:hypothetical protein
MSIQLPQINTTFPKRKLTGLEFDESEEEE